MGLRVCSKLASSTPIIKSHICAVKHRRCGRARGILAPCAANRVAAYGTQGWGASGCFFARSAYLRRGLPGTIMDSSNVGYIGRAPRLGLALQIITCIVAAVLLTGVAQVATNYTLDWIGPAFFAK